MLLISFLKEVLRLSTRLISFLKAVKLQNAINIIGMKLVQNGSFKTYDQL